MTKTVGDSAVRRRARHRPAAGLVGLAVLALVTGCGSDQEPAPDITTGPSGVRWQGYHGVALPQTDQGPKSTADGAATGFARSPAGAAVAAITHTVRMSVAPDNQWAKVIAQEVVPGPARDEWSVNRVQLSITGPAAPEYAPRLLGYKIIGYTPQKTAVDIYSEYSDGSKAVNHTTVEWFLDDWRLRLPDPGSTTRPIDAITELPSDIVKLEAPKP
ncbi:hypothetical protein [Nocardia goodfellowii]|uniref:DUF8175 domain-containing protein n=1 Tax=Nocardia goodfellowii TaxID=882446 RepID=A0ABS4QG08_9NOCA|nr:hypothetical protein [Nocardia goodfellowii]MBP2190636.1 hypothetical protein [Nocardia goodfellowii]